MSPEGEALLVERVSALSQELDTLRAIILSVGEVITGAISRLPKQPEGVLKLDTNLMLVTTADAEVTKASV